MKIKQYIVTYNNAVWVNKGLESIFANLSEYELSILQIFVINNHSNLQIEEKYLDKITVLNNVLRPDFSTGQLPRNWNQAIINGFVDLNNPDCDILITNQDDTIFKANYVNRLIELHKQYDLITFGHGDNVVSYTPNAVKRIGLWDERFPMGFQEADYFTRAYLYLKDRSMINDPNHQRNHNRIPDEDWIIDYTVPSGHNRNEPYHMAGGIGRHTRYMYIVKWGINPDNGYKEIDRAQQRLPNFIYYPYFEKDVQTLYEQQYIQNF